jgi:4-amino-4-deoxy-L-arabinose transferase-like glycosyltransferase
VDWSDRRFGTGAAIVLAMSAFHLLFRLGRQYVVSWDEALYGITAWEALTTGSWIVTTFLGEVDYYNSKPPLNAWLIALSFHLFGPGPVSLRIWSVLASWVTVAVLMLWTRRMFGAAAGLMAGAVLGTTFGFLHVHSGRSGNADSLFTLAIVLTVMAVWASRREARWLIAIGPTLAAAFLLKGAAVALPAAFLVTVVLFELALPAGERVLLSRAARGPLLVATMLFLTLAGGWAAARYAADGTEFFRQMVTNDLVGITLTVQEGHEGHPLFYFDVLQRYQYDWLGAAVLVCLFSPAARRRFRTAVTGLHSSHTGRVLSAWAGICLLVPSMMQTKLSWYLNPLYPVCAIGIALVFVHGLTDPLTQSPGVRRVAVVVTLVLALGVSQGRSIWHVAVQRHLDRSPQGLLLEHAPVLAGARVFKTDWEPADRLVAEAFVGARQATAADAGAFARQSDTGDFLLVARGDAVPESVVLVDEGPRYALYRRSTGRPGQPSEAD